MKLGNGPKLNKIWKQRNNRPHKPMSKPINDGESAFPCLPPDANPNAYAMFPTSPGMSLRAYFAGQAMTAITATSIHQGVTISYQEAAINCCLFADALIAELGKEQA